MIRAGELCNRTVVIAGKHESIQAAARRMRDFHVGALVIVEERGAKRYPVAMITDRDLVVGVLAEDTEHLQKLMLEDIVTTWEVATAREDESAVEVLKRMRAYGVRRLPIVDDSDALVGIIAFDDLIGFVAELLQDLDRLVSRELDHEAERRP